MKATDDPIEGSNEVSRNSMCLSKSSFVAVKGAKFSKYSVLNREGYKKF